MATWSGWQNEFLLAARIIETPPNRDFLTEWAKHASSPQCRDNPIDLHAKVGGSTNCARPAGFTAWTQRYGSHADAATAFSRQVNSNAFAAILDTLGTGNPWQDPGYENVHKALLAWPSNTFAAYYLSRAKSTQGVGGSDGGTFDAKGLGGWKSLMHSANHNLPSALRKSKANTNAALRAVSKGRKVKP